MTFLNDTPAGRMVQSWIKVFVSTILALFLADLINGSGTLNLTSVWTYVSAGLVAVLPLVINYLNPSYGRYGAGSDDVIEGEVVEVFNEEEYKGE